MWEINRNTLLIIGRSWKLLYRCTLISIDNNSAVALISCYRTFESGRVISDFFLTLYHVFDDIDKVVFIGLLYGIGSREWKRTAWCDDITRFNRSFAVVQCNGIFVSVLYGNKAFRNIGKVHFTGIGFIFVNKVEFECSIARWTVTAYTSETYNRFRTAERIVSHSKAPAASYHIRKVPVIFRFAICRSRNNNTAFQRISTGITIIV